MIQNRSNFFKILLALFIVITAFLVGKKYVINHFKKELVIKEDLSEKAYYDSKIKNHDPDLNWKLGEFLNTVNQPKINGESAIMVDIESGKILFEKDINQQMPIASLVKIMTAVVALEHKSLDDEIYISNTAANIGENSMGLCESEVYTLEELMYGLLLNSGNDAATAIAEGVAGDLETFVFWMNLKAKELGLENTHFEDSCGLNDSTYSTAADLVKLTKYAMGYEEFRNFVSTFNYEIPYSEKHKYVYLENQTNLLTSYPGVSGVKTGYTEEAGLCLVTFAENEGKKLVGVVLNSQDRKGDMILMLDHGFSTLGITVEHTLLDPVFY